MARPRFENLEPKRQEQILAAAGAEFAERGYTGASVNRILESAGLSKGVLYYYFEDKRDLFATTLETAMLRLFEQSGMSGDLGVLEGWASSLSADDYWDALLAMSREEAVVARSNEWHARMARSWSRFREEPEARVATEQVVDVGRRMVRALVRRGRDLGLVRRDMPEDLLVDWFMALDEAADRWFVSRMGEVDEVELQELADMRVELIRDLLDARHEGWEQ